MPLEAEHQAVFVGNQPDDDLVEVGSPRDEEFFELLERVIFALLVFGQAIGARADRLEIGRMCLDVAAVDIDMLRDDRHQGRRHGQQQGRMRENGNASCRERVCQYVYISVVAVSLKKKKK